MIKSGHPWNAQDDHGRTAAEVAMSKEIYEFLLEEAVRSEMLLNLLDQKSEKKESMDYLDQRICYNADGTLLTDEDRNAVMVHL